MKLAEMSCKWVEGRVPRIDTHILRSSTLNEAEKVQKSFFRLLNKLREF